MIARVLSAEVRGVEPHITTIEADVTTGLPSFITVGLPEGAIRDSRQRVIAAMMNSGYLVPPKRITVSVSAAPLRRDAGAFDLPIAAAIAAATGQTASVGRIDHYLLVGELALDGSLRSVRGAVAFAVAAHRAGLTGIVVPAENAAEAAVAEGLQVRVAESLAQVLRFLDGGAELPTADRHQGRAVPPSSAPDFADVRGQEHAKRALEVAAAGDHNVVLIGPPGCGKTMLAQRVPGILPPLAANDALEATIIHSVAGLTHGSNHRVADPPFRAPHHSISAPGLVGGGSWPLPGEASLAHRGVLFLDELPEFRRGIPEVLRQPLDHGHVTLTCKGEAVDLPASFVLIAAMNPCPCGYYLHPATTCCCDPQDVLRYITRAVGPLLDRIDLHLEVPAVRYRDLADTRTGEPSERIRERVIRAREAQTARFHGRTDVRANSRMSDSDLVSYCRVGAGTDALLRTAISRLALSARAYKRVLMIARTIADLDGGGDITTVHVAEAVQYRSLDRLRPRTPAAPASAA